MKSKFRVDHGFTLIELIMVIVILGILAATVAPKFVNLSSDANLATLKGLRASLLSSSKMYHSKAVINNIGLNEKYNISGAEIDGTAITYGYPELSYIIGNTQDLTAMVDVNADEWFAMGDFSNKSYHVTLNSLAKLRAAPNDDPSDRRVVDITDSDCYVTYVNATKLLSGEIEAPVITLTANGEGC